MAAPAEVAYAQSSRPESASTLRTIVDLVRRITHADVISIVGLSMTEMTMTWRAASGFRAHIIDGEKPLVRSITNRIASRALSASEALIIDGIGVNPDFPAENFPVHSAEGVRDLAVAVLRVRGETRGAILAGYRQAHHFTDDEKRLLQDLADMAAVVLDNSRLLEAAKTAEERFRTVVEAAPSAMIMVNDEGRMALVNAQTERLFGYPRSELLGQPVEMLVPKRFGDAHPDHRSNFFLGPSARPMGAGRDLSGLRKDGSEVPIEIGLNPIQTDEGTFVLADIIDITQRKRDELALRESEERLRMAQHAAAFGTFEWNVQTGVNIWSPELEAMYGLAPGSFGATQPAWENLVHPDDRAATIELVKQAFDTGEPREGEWRVIWPDGSVHWLFGRFQAVKDSSGKPLRLTGVNMDVTERMNVEDALRSSEARARHGQKIWEHTFDAITEGILVYDKEMNIVRCNVRAAEMMELRPAEVIGLSFNEVFARLFGQRAAAYYLTEVREASSVFEVETEHGQRYLVSMSQLEQIDGDPVSVITWTDVTRFLEMQDQLSRSRRLASVGELAAGVAHEINNPLAAITTCAEATMRDLGAIPEMKTVAGDHQWSYYLEEIVRQALRCKEITRGLLDLTRQRQANRVLCDLNEIVSQCARVASQRANSPSIEFEIQLDQNAHEVATDAALLSQILDNLLSNAIDAVGDSGGKVNVSTSRDRDRLSVEIADTGSGIPADVLARIFDPFFSTKGAGKGYGLGLAISLTLAESLGGALTVESKEGAGSRFRLWLPRRVPEQ